MRDFYVHFFERLRDDGFSAVIVPDGERALDVLNKEAMDLALLDWNLPGISGEHLLRALRASPTTRSLGIMMITGRRALGDEIKALDAGADDYLLKPFDENELRARLRSLRRRREFSIGRRQASLYPELGIDPDADLLRIAGRRVHLTSKEMGLLGIFLLQPNMLHTHADLWEKLWGYESDSWESRLLFTVSSLRRKLGGDWGGSIKRRSGKGYAFEGPL